MNHQKRPRSEEALRSLRELERLFRPLPKESPLVEQGAQSRNNKANFATNSKVSADRVQRRGCGGPR